MDVLRAAGCTTYARYHAQGSLIQYPDVEVYDFPYSGNSAFVEVSVVNPAQARLVRQAAQVPLSAAAAREREKRAKYASLAAQHKAALFPAVMEAFGAFGPGLKNILGACAARVSEERFAESVLARTWASASFRQFWSQRIAVSFWRGAHQMDLVIREIRAAREAGVGASAPFSAARC